MSTTTVRIKRETKQALDRIAIKLGRRLRMSSITLSKHTGGPSSLTVRIKHMQR